MLTPIAADKTRTSYNNAEFIQHLVDGDSGVGTQISAGDHNGDGKLDIISSNMKSLSIFIQQP